MTAGVLVTSIDSETSDFDNRIIGMMFGSTELDFDFIEETFREQGFSAFLLFNLCDLII